MKPFDGETLRLPPMAYEIRRVDNLTEDGDRMLDGLLVPNEEVIAVAAHLPKRRAVQTLWHETIHAALLGAGIEKHNEQQVDALAHGIMSAIQHNPWLVRATERSGKSG
jgi:hypothetical protein